MPSGSVAGSSRRISSASSAWRRVVSRSASDVIEKHYVSPTSLLVMQYAYDERVSVAANGRLGIRVLAANAVNASAFLIFEE